MSSRSNDLTSHNPKVLNETINNLTVNTINNVLYTATPYGAVNIISFNIPSHTYHVIEMPNQIIICNNFTTPAATYSIVLPLISPSMIGHTITITTNDATFNANSCVLNILPSGSNVIDGGQTFTATGSGAAFYGLIFNPPVQFTCDGVQWLSNKQP